MQGFTRTAVFLASALAFTAAWAQYHPAPGFAVGAPMSRFINNSYLTQQLVNDTSFRKSLAGNAAPAQPARAGVVFRPVAGASPVAAELAKSYPPPSRADAQRVFETLLAGYRKIETRFGIPPHDLAGATAAFIAGSYMGYHNVDFPDAHFRPLVDQMRTILGDVPGIRGASEAHKREMYETMAILGMFMATTQMALKTQPNPQAEANMRQAAKGYLEQFLQADAQRVQIGANGVTLQ